MCHEITISTSLLSLSGINSTKLDEKEVAIIAVLAKEKQIQFMGLFEKTKNHYMMDKKTFINRLKKLVKNGDVKHMRKHYFLVSRNRRKQYETLNKELTKYEKAFEKHKETKFLFEQLMILDNIFKNLYTKIQYERLCFWSDYSKSEQHVLKDTIRRCEKLIINISDNTKKGDPKPNHLLPPYEIICFTKVSKS